MYLKTLDAGMGLYTNKFDQNIKFPIKIFITRYRVRKIHVFFFVRANNIKKMTENLSCKACKRI